MALLTCWGRTGLWSCLRRIECVCDLSGKEGSTEPCYEFVSSVLFVVGRCMEGGRDCLSDDGGFGGIFLYENITDG